MTTDSTSRFRTASKTVHPVILLLAFFPFMTIAFEAETVETAPLNILCIGDSITQGGISHREEYTYRLPLQTLLWQSGITFDFVGTQQQGLHAEAIWPDAAGHPFDPDHEGYYGWRTAAVVDKIRDNLPDMPPPDVALVHLGTNDQKHGDFENSVGTPLRELIVLLRERNPEVIVLLGHLNFDSGAALEIRELVEAVAAEMDRPESPVRTVHHYRGWVADPTLPWTDTFDWAHPNPRGQSKMAEAWLQTLRTLLETAVDTPPPPRITPEDQAAFGHGVGRSLCLLQGSSPEDPQTLRILFYGQSISEDAWWRQVVAGLEARHPHTRIIAQNRALGGFAAQRLVRTVATDLKGFDPDLIIFHVFGADSEYEAIIQHLRTHSSADILLQTDHLGRGAPWKEEPTDPAAITRDNWPAFMNYVHLPAVADKYGCGLLRQRDFWKRYLRDNDVRPADLLRDNIHLNASGNRLMAELALAYLDAPAPDDLNPFDNDRVHTLLPDRDFKVVEGAIEIEFNGNRIDLVPTKGAEASEIELLLDGLSPSGHPECWAFTRATPRPGGKWPALHGIRAETLPVSETWTLHVHREAGVDASDEGPFLFRLVGSVTGPDGEGRSDQPFVSDSGRVAFDPDGWNVAYSMKLAGVETVPDTFRIVFESYPLARDSARLRPDEAMPLVSGLDPGPHRLRLTGAVDTISALRIYRPALATP